MINKFRSSLILVSLVVFAALKGTAIIGVGVNFATIVLEKVSPGGVYNIRTLQRIPYTITNAGTGEANIVVVIDQPGPTELKKGYEPIADPSWIKVVPNEFTLGPNEKMKCDVILSVPEDQKLVGRSFQAMIMAKSIGDTFAAAAADRFYFSVGVEGPEEFQKAKKKKTLAVLNFDVDPQELYLSVPLGKKVDVLKDLDKAITVLNKGKQKLLIKAESVPMEPETRLAVNYEFTPSTGFVSFKPAEFKVGSKAIKEERMFIEIPNEEQHRNKKYMFLIKTTPVGYPAELYTRVMVTVE